MRAFENIRALLVTPDTFWKKAWPAICLDPQPTSVQEPDCPLQEVECSTAPRSVVLKLELGSSSTAEAKAMSRFGFANRRSSKQESRDLIRDQSQTKEDEARFAISHGHDWEKLSKHWNRIFSFWADFQQLLWPIAAHFGSRALNLELTCPHQIQSAVGKVVFTKCKFYLGNFAMEHKIM